MAGNPDAAHIAVQDRQQIENVIGLYCRAVDRLDVELLKSIYHEDASNERGGFSGSAHEFAEVAINTLKSMCSYTMHTVTHQVIDIRGERALAESYYVAYHLVPGGEESLTAFFGPKYAARQQAAGAGGVDHEYIAGGRYIDRLEKRAGIWRISSREITNEWHQCRPVTFNLEEGIPSLVHRPGRRDREDVIYKGWAE